MNKTKKLTTFTTLWILCLCFMANTWGQTPDACFFTTDTVGCTPYFVTMTSCSSGSNPRYNFDVDPLAPSSFRENVGVATHTYIKEGSYSIIQSIRATGTNKPDTLRARYIRVIKSVTPNVALYLCSNNVVIIDIIDAQFPIYSIDFGDSTSTLTNPKTTVTHTYSNSKTRTITITGKFLAGNCPTTISKTITPQNSVSYQKHFRAQENSSNNQDFDVVINTNANLEYSFFKKDGTLLKNIKYIGGLQTFTISNIANQCVYFTVKDYCNILYTSPTTCFTNFNIATTDTSIVTSWNAQNDNIIKNFILKRDNILLTTLPSDVAKYEDKTVKCGKTYCYNWAVEFTDSTTITSNKCVQAISNKTPDAPIQTLASFDNQNVLHLNWSIPKNSSYKNSIITDESNPSKVTSQRDTAISFSNISNTVCYSISYIDSCDKQSAVAQNLCPIYLTVNDLGAGIYETNWSAYSPSSTNNIYQVFENNVLIYEGPQTTFITTNADTLIQLKTYVVKAKTKSGEVQSNTVNINQSMKVFFPSAFSPDGDNINDTFFAKTRFVKSFKIGIYNIWGQPVFSSTSNAEHWNGDKQPNGTYNYIAEAQDHQGNIKTYRGQVLLIR
jgi:gliding motility-associated-like protein